MEKIFLYNIGGEAIAEATACQDAKSGWLHYETIGYKESEKEAFYEIHDSLQSCATEDYPPHFIFTIYAEHDENGEYLYREQYQDHTGTFLDSKLVTFFD